MDHSFDGEAFLMSLPLFSFRQLNTNLLFTGVKFSLLNKFTLEIFIGFLTIELSFFLFRSAFKHYFLLITWTIIFLFFSPRWWQASASFEVILISVTFNMSVALFFELLVAYRMRIPEICYFYDYTGLFRISKSIVLFS